MHMQLPSALIHKEVAAHAIPSLAHTPIPIPLMVITIIETPIAIYANPVNRFCSIFSTARIRISTPIKAHAFSVYVHFIGIVERSANFNSPLHAGAHIFAAPTDRSPISNTAAFMILLILLSIFSSPLLSSLSSRLFLRNAITRISSISIHIFIFSIFLFIWNYFLYTYLICNEISHMSNCFF